MKTLLTIAIIAVLGVSSTNLFMNYKTSQKCDALVVNLEIQLAERDAKIQTLQDKIKKLEDKIKKAEKLLPGYLRSKLKD
jgi:peptidoglycan hydrolase CwlO-like protein